MKIVLINGTAAGYGQGTEKLTDIIANTFRELEVTVTEINLASMKLPYYDGTSYPTVEKILNEIKASDGAVFACSALKFSPSAVMQTFLEHLDTSLYGDFLEGKNCFTVVSSYDGSEYFADEYLSRVLRSVGAYAQIRLAAGKEYAKRISYDSSVIDVVEKHAEDFFRVLKRGTTFIISDNAQTTVYNEPSTPPQNVQTRQGEAPRAYAPVADAYKKNTENYRPKHADDSLYTPDNNEFQGTHYTPAPEPKYEKRPENVGSYESGDYSAPISAYTKENFPQNDRTAYTQNSYNIQKTPQGYGNNEHIPQQPQQNYDRMGYNPQGRDETYSQPNYTSQSYRPQNIPENNYDSRNYAPQQNYTPERSQINYTTFDKQQEADINELTRLLAGEYNRENKMGGYSASAEPPRQRRAEPTFRTAFTPQQAEPPVVPHIRSCKQKTQSLYHHFQATHAKGVEAIIQINISGSENFSSWLAIANGECTYADGVYPSPSVTIFADTAIWSDILDAKITAQKAFMVGQIKVRGNFALLSKFDQLFKLGI